jgi:hypothetical protein
MTVRIDTKNYASLYDAALSQITFGSVEQGISFLIGVLDGASMQVGSLECAELELRGHLLQQLLLEDPSCAYAMAHPGDSMGLSNILAESSFEQATSKMGRLLFAKTRGLPIARALAHRKTNIERLIAQATKDQLAVLNCANDEPANGRSYDLICATSIADLLTGAPLVAEMGRLATHLTDRGRIIFPSLLKQHPGTGWRSICLNWKPCTHDEHSLMRMAAKAGLRARTYRDEADCMAWTELALRRQK